MTAPLHSLCVFCGSSPGINPVYRNAAERLGRLLAEHRIRLVYGGGKVGLMGAVADACLDAGGEVVGVIPQSLRTKELAHETVTRLHVVDTMHQRKALMAELSDGFLCLPGGYGTFEEFCEVITWAQLGIHEKPCALLNISRYYDPLLAQFQHGVTEGFVRQLHWDMLLVDSDPEALLNRMQHFHARYIAKWMGVSEV